MKVVGIDLSADERRESGVCLLERRCAQTFLVMTDEALIALVRRFRPKLVAIDAPLSLPPGRKSIHDRRGQHLRPCDRQLLQRGIPFFPITLGAMRKLTERGIRVKARLEAEGFRVIEVFPGGAQDVLGLPRKHYDLRGLRDGLRRLGIKGIPDEVTHDELDAITAAYVGQLFLRGETEVLGDWEKGAIVMPKKGPYPDAFLRGLRLYWKGYYWHSHEAWEELWRSVGEPERSFLKALIQLDAALIHSDRGDWKGVRNLLRRVERYLSDCPGEVFGISVRGLIRQVKTFQAVVEALLKGQKETFHWGVKPRIIPKGLIPPRRERLRRSPHDIPDKLKGRRRRG